MFCFEVMFRYSQSHKYLSIQITFDNNVVSFLITHILELEMGRYQQIWILAVRFSSIFFKFFERSNQKVNIIDETFFEHMFLCVVYQLSNRQNIYLQSISFHILILLLSFFILIKISNIYSFILILLSFTFIFQF